MPLLFISYKRGTHGIFEFMDHLNEESYAVWFDKFDIKVGDKDWQESIYSGIDACDAFVLCLTEAAAKSQYVQDEVQRAVEKERKLQAKADKAGKGETIKHIFPVLMQADVQGGRIAELLTEVGLSERNQCIDLSMLATDSHIWDANFKIMLKELREQGIAPSRYDRRLLSKDNSETQLYKRYLRTMVDDLSRVDIRQTLNPEYDSGELQRRDLYVPPPTEFKLVLDIQNYDVSDHWLFRDASLAEGIENTPLDDDFRAVLTNEYADIKRRWQTNQIESDDWNPSILQLILEKHRRQLHQRQIEDRYRRLGRLDDVYQVITLDAVQLAATYKRVMILGGSGSGKSFFGKFLAATLADELDQRPKHSDLDYWIYSGLTPVYVKMPALAAHLEEHDWTAEDFWGYIETQLTGSLAGFDEDLRGDLEDGLGVLIFDELDALFSEVELDNEERSTQLDALFNSITEKFRGIRIVLLTRDHAFTYWQPQYFLTVNIAPFDDARRRQLLNRFFHADSKVGGKDKSNNTIASEVDGLMAELENYDEELAGNPRFITLLATLYPSKYGVLYRKTVDLMLRMSSQKGEDALTLDELLNPKGVDKFKDEFGSGKDALVKMLAQFAYNSLEEFPQSNPMGEDLSALLWRIIRRHTKAYGGNSDDVSAFITQYTGIFIGGDDFRFTNEAFRRYLAAEHIATQFLNDDRRRRDDDHTLLRSLIEKDTNAWYQSARIVGDLMEEPEDLLTVIDDLVDDEPPETISADDERFYSAWLAARIAVDQLERLDEDNLPKWMRRVVPQKVEELANWLMLLVNTQGAPRFPDNKDRVDMQIRSETGRLLGRLGDDRAGVGCTEKGVPDLLWIPVPEGTYNVGEVPHHPRMPGDLKAQSVNTSGFDIAKYPVTYAQFNAFVEAGGYTDPAFWSETGWSWRDGRDTPYEGWDDPAWHVASHPVVGVSWYEADAYCRWLNATIGENGATIRLPTEFEWEIAARGTTDNVYPYGNDYISHYANGRETAIERVTVVGLFAEGDSPLGVADMSGNVYEWCASIYEEDAKSPLDYEKRRVLKGGSWRSYRGFLRIAARYWAYPYLSTNYWGFRVVKARDNA